MNNDFNTTLAAMSIEDKVALLTAAACGVPRRCRSTVSKISL